MTALTVDFHSHTAHSDGTLSAQELANFMGERKVSVFAISDHDTLAAYGTFEPPAGARVVTGIEINTTYRDNEVHILGFRLPLDDAALNTLLDNNRQARLRRVEKMVDKLRRGGYGITVENVKDAAGDAHSIGRPHVAKALILAGMAPNIEWAFRNLLRGGKPGYVPSTHISPQTAIEAIGAAGGVAVLAHPGRLRDRALIDELVHCGLRGLEVFYPLHDADDVRFFREKATRYSLAMTAGSDFHDIRYHAHGVGAVVEAEDIRAFLELVLT